MATTATASSRFSAFLQVPAKQPHKFPVAVNNKQVIYITKLQTTSHAKTPLLNKLIPFLRFASTSSTPALEEEEDQEKGDDDVLLQSESSPLNQDPLTISSMRGCQACGKEEIEMGCNGEGRIQGGIATVPGFGWWPIKAYRPCPSYLATGGRYRRSGQSMNEIGFGGGGRAASVGNDKNSQSSQKQQGPRKLKS